MLQSTFELTMERHIRQLATFKRPIWFGQYSALGVPYSG